MVNDTEPAKLILPFLQRADELQKHEPLVAYYCRLYAMERGLKIPAKERTKTTSALLVSLMKQLEKDKKSLTLGPEDNLYVEGFASNVFAKADKQDRAGRADLTTAKTFYAASIFFEILSQFGEVQPEIEQKQKYAIWKAADIRKAIKEGRRPEPGPPVGDQDLSGPVDSAWEGNSPPGQLRQENSQVSQSKAFARSVPDEGTKPEPSSQLPRNVQYYSADEMEPPPSFSGPDYQRVGSHSQAPNSQASQSKAFASSVPDGGTKPEPSSQFPRNVQHYSADTMEPPPSFSGPDYQGVDSYSQAPQDFSHSHPTVQSSSYYAVQGRPQDASGGQLGAGYSFSPSHDTMNVSQPHNSNYQSYSTIHEGNFDSQPVSHISYPSNPSYYQNVNGNDSSSIPYHVNSSPNPEFESNLQYNSVTGINAAYVESTSLERAPSVPAFAPAAAYSYDSSYQPPPEKIAEAHKAARFAVGALAFDDVPTAVEHLKRSLELLTLPSTRQ
ncbi:protein HOMOLOG OF MAMMALIAN LYST-INTERACTING PROTEIN 5 [Cryptomeria japonica]|uniref:protein HOMOLOG OF MAMMALIAN LYST-INTERACTING PROTEIN 5 n=1 Tax=Cryptomeria japonica TaxID=3369 RepID=UPI0027DAB394|nr:protein HOMOLOG OF MAMMALIAN LYST-INTERACTING PROTEIN 5 [Cryptomeria japonica]XP_057831013.2 protein HOMOLOG OF MAMMALIAN LYST-INTERACTING PROTEIN 5 [Cryptomeria japonica]